MDLALGGRVAMIAAASKGLGKACAVALAAEGCRVSICARDLNTLEATRQELGGDALAVRADVSSAEDLETWHRETVARFGPVDILITNTGGPPVARFMDLDDETWRTGIEATLMNVVRLVRLVLPDMRQRRWGRIVHLTSLVAKQPAPELTISSTLRAGLSALTRTLATEFGCDGITVNAVLTGTVMTDRQAAIAKGRSLPLEEHVRRAAAEIPLRRVGEPREIGEVVAFLASERASFVTGVSMLVDGGAVRSTL